MEPGGWPPSGTCSLPSPRPHPFEAIGTFDKAAAGSVAGSVAESVAGSVAES